MGTQPFWGENPSDLERDVLDSQDLTDDIFAPKNLGGRRSADYTDFVGAAHILVSEHRAFGQRPLAQFKIILALAENLRVPVLIASGDLGDGANLGTN